MDPRDCRTFSSFELNLRTGELHASGHPVALERQPARVLAFLVANAGRLVTREELRKAIWPAVHVDFDRGLNYCLRRIRLALGDDAKLPKFIETVPRQGYRFIAVVSSGYVPQPRRRLAARRIAAVVAAAGIAAAAIVLETGGRNQSHHRIAVAVLKTVHDALF